MSLPARVAPLHQLLSRLKLRHLELLGALVRTGSVHRAGQALGLGQPAASKLLAELESAFGVSLFERSSRGVIPTAYGRALAQHAGQMLTDLEAARADLETVARGGSGRVRAGVLQVTLPVLVPRTLLRLQQSAPGVVVSLHEDTSDVLLSALIQGDCDCMVGRLMPQTARPELQAEVLYDEPTHIVARVGHPLSRSSRVTAAALARQSWILPPPEAPLRRLIDAFFREAGQPAPLPLAESVSLLANEVILRGSDVLSVMPRAVAQHYARLGVLVILPFTPTWHLPPVGVVIRADRQATPALAAFVSALRAEASVLVGEAA